MRSHYQELTLERERDAFAEELEEVKEAFNYMRGELAGIDEAAQSLYNRIPQPQELTPPPTKTIFDTPSPSPGLGFFGEGSGPTLSPQRTRGETPRRPTRQVPLPASFNSRFAMGTDVQERANTKLIPRKK